MSGVRDGKVFQNQMKTKLAFSWYNFFFTVASPNLVSFNDPAESTRLQYSPYQSGFIMPHVSEGWQLLKA